MPVLRSSMLSTFLRKVQNNIRHFSQKYKKDLQKTEKCCRIRGYGYGANTLFHSNFQKGMISMKKGSLRAAEYNARKEFIKNEVSGKVRRYFGKTVENATKREIYTAVSFTIRDEIMEKWVRYQQYADKTPGKELYYLSFEFLMGRAMGNNLMNMTETDLYRDALADMNIDLGDIEEQENDAGLGNGGLGRLAACFLDSLTNLELPAFGCGIRYEYGLFRQKIVDGAVGMVEMALKKLSENNVVELDDERKAQMVCNLMVVLCGNKDAQPIVNSGSVY